MTTGCYKPPAELTGEERALLAAGRVPPAWPPRDRWPRREEQLLAVLSSSRSENWQAPIVRLHRQRPQLGYWGTFPGDSTPGAMFQAIRQALATR
jgi:hypothetical protein